MIIYLASPPAPGEWGDRMDLIMLIVLGVVIIAIAMFFIAGLALIGDSQVGIVTKMMFGKTMPQGQVIARNGEVGVQADTLMPGLYWRIPIIWKIEKTYVTQI
jgi:uncharacterized membrane protein YqiK